jgi:hypothetical protein
VQDDRVVVAGAGHRPRLPVKAAGQLIECVLADTKSGNAGGHCTGGSRGPTSRCEDQQAGTGVGQKELTSRALRSGSIGTTTAPVCSTP